MLISRSCANRWNPGHIDDLIPAFAGAAEHERFLIVGQAVVQERRRHTGLNQRPDLIFHQADQRRDNDGDAREQERRDLIADGFARTRRHDGQNVLSGQKLFHNGFLPGAEVVIAENFF